MISIVGQEDIVAEVILWMSQIGFFIGVSYAVIGKKGWFSYLGSDCDTPWKFGVWFLGIWFFATGIGFLMAVVWPVVLIMGSLYSIGALLFFLREKYNGKDTPQDIEYPD